MSTGGLGRWGWEEPLSFDIFEEILIYECGGGGGAEVH